MEKGNSEKLSLPNKIKAAIELTGLALILGGVIYIGCQVNKREQEYKMSLTQQAINIAEIAVNKHINGKLELDELAYILSKTGYTEFTLGVGDKETPTIVKNHAYFSKKQLEDFVKSHEVK